MGRFVSGDVVVVPFPFSDLSSAKRRPALVLAELEGDDRIVCQITSRPVGDQDAMPLGETDFEAGGLRQASNVRPNRLFTADSRLILYAVGRVRADVHSRIVDRVVDILRR
jgi:mRNA interferase MazF